MSRSSSPLLLVLAALLLAAAAVPGVHADTIATDGDDWSGGDTPLSDSPDHQIYYMTTADPVPVPDDTPEQSLESGFDLVAASSPADDMVDFPAPHTADDSTPAAKPVLMMHPTAAAGPGATKGGSTDCPDGSAFVNCFADPCKTASCPAGTTCTSDFCECLGLGLLGR
jgi:hypothetical protein